VPGSRGGIVDPVCMWDVPEGSNRLGCGLRVGRKRHILGLQDVDVCEGGCVGDVDAVPPG
jgi:hypothetical protein